MRCSSNDAMEHTKSYRLENELFRKHIDLCEERAEVSFYKEKLKESYRSYDELNRSFQDSQKTIEELQTQLSHFTLLIPK